MKPKLLLAAAALLGVGVVVWSSSSTSSRRQHRHAIGSITVERGRAEERRALAAAAAASGADPSAPPGAAAGEPVVEDMLRNRSVESLLSRLSSSEDYLVIDAADGLRARKAVVAIPKLVAMDIVARPDPARTVIDALGHLAGNATGADRSTAVDRLLSWLEQEKKRDSADAPGNVLQIYEALGKTADARAAAALERELADSSVPLAALTVVVDSLVALDQSSSKSALSAARTRVSELAIEDSFQREIQAELLAKIDHALTAL